MHVRLPLVALASALLALSAAAQSVTVTVLTGQVAIPDDAYIGIGDGNDGTGTDAGMVCADLDFSIQASLQVMSGRLRVGVTHTYIGDLTIKLRSPAGVVLPVLVRAQGDAPSDVPTDDGVGTGGDSSRLTGSAPLAFFDGAPTDAEALGTGLGSSQTACGSNGLCDYAPNPSAATGQPGTISSFAGFAGEPSAGTWQACVGDADFGADGTFDSVQLTLSGPAVAAEDAPESRFAFGLVGANPFGSTTTLELRVAETQAVRATLHDPLGREVARLYDGTAVADRDLHFEIDGTDLPAGTYVVRVVGASFTAAQAVTVAR